MFNNRYIFQHAQARLIQGICYHFSNTAGQINREPTMISSEKNIKLL